MQPIHSFEEAVERAMRHLEAFSRPSPIASSHGLDPGALRNHYLQKQGLKELADDPEGLVERARRNAEAHDALRLAVALKEFMGEELPPEAKQWLSEYLMKRRERPMAKSGRGSGSGAELAIHAVISALVADGMQATRNQGSEAHSACDAVAEAMHRLRRKPSSYSRIEKIWLRIKAMEVEPGHVRFELR